MRRATYKNTYIARGRLWTVYSKTILWFAYVREKTGRRSLLYILHKHSTYIYNLYIGGNVMKSIDTVRLRKWVGWLGMLLPIIVLALCLIF